MSVITYNCGNNNVSYYDTVGVTSTDITHSLIINH